MAHYYLATWVFFDSAEDPGPDCWMPRGSEELALVGGFPHIDLRPDGTTGTGHNLVALAERPADETGMVYLGEESLDEELPSLVTRTVGDLLGVTLDATRLREIIAELLMVHGTEDGTRWRNVRPSRIRQRYEILLGGLIWSQAVVAGGATITDDFNRADSTDLGADWNEDIRDWSIDTNELLLNTQAGAGTGIVRNVNDLDSDDHYCQFVRVSDVVNGGPIVRKLATTEQTGYLVYILAGSDMRLFRLDDGATTRLDGGGGTITHDPPDTVKGEIDGSTFKGYWNGDEILSVTDTDITGNLQVALRQDDDTALQSWDDFEAADLAAETGPPTGTLALLGVGV